jgi:hypothetical protein
MAQEIMGPVHRHLWGDEAHTGAHPEDVGVDGEGMLFAGEQEDAGDALGAHPAKLSQKEACRLHGKVMEEGEIQTSVFLLEEAQDLPDPFRFLPGQSCDPNSWLNRPETGGPSGVPGGKAFLQSLKCAVSQEIRGGLGEDDLDEGLQGIGRLLLLFGPSVMALQGRQKLPPFRFDELVACGVGCHGIIVERFV